MNKQINKQYIDYIRDNQLQREGSSADEFNGKNMSPEDPDLSKGHYRLKEIIKQYHCKNIMEIGFNVGHGSVLFLCASPDTKVVSFDICLESRKESWSTAKTFIDKLFPGRHTLIPGSSLESVPGYNKNNPDVKFDLILIDGGHTLNIATKDLINCEKLAHDRTIVIMDDVVTDSPISYRNGKPIGNYTTGPTLAWSEAVKNNKITQLGQENHISKSKGLAWGMYNK